jgi:hypothetical protein
MNNNSFNLNNDVDIDDNINYGICQTFFFTISNSQLKMLE